MFDIGERVVYGKSGVCLIKDITEQELIINQKRTYYVLQPFSQQNSIIYAPVDSDKVSIRPVMTADEANRLIDEMPKIAKQVCEDPINEQKSETLTVFSNSSEDLAVIATRIYEKKKFAKAHKKKLGTIDEKNMRIAETLLFGELSVALNIPLEEVSTYIDKRLNP